MNSIKHFDIKCPICGNKDFITIKEESDARCNFAIEDKNLLLGCTKCHLILNFNEYAVGLSLSIEEEDKRLNDERKKLQQSIDFLEGKKQHLIENGAPQNEIEEIEWKIKMHKQELNSVSVEEEGYQESIPPYTKQPSTMPDEIRKPVLEAISEYYDEDQKNIKK